MDNCIKKVKKNMVTKIEALYEALLPMKVATFDEITQKASTIIDATPNRRYIYRKYVTKLIQDHKLRRIRKKLYLILSPLEKPETYMPDKILIAAKIKQDYYLGYHTALEYYGCAQSLWNETYICIKPKNRFDPFTYKRLSFRPVFTKDITTEIQQKSYAGTTVRVSSKERTLIECVAKIQYAGGWEEAIKSLEGLGGLSSENLTTLLHEHANQTTVRKTGFVLEFLRDRSVFYEHIKDENLRHIQQLVTGPPQYLIRKEKGPLNPKWNLYIPEGFKDKMRSI
jgi:predicted transcriptional regulator of viral defense system